MLKNEGKKPSYLVGSRLGSISGDFLGKLGDFFSKSSGHSIATGCQLETVAYYELQCQRRAEDLSKLRCPNRLISRVVQGAEFVRENKRKPKRSQVRPPDLGTFLKKHYLWTQVLLEKGLQIKAFGHNFLNVSLD